MVVKDSPAVRGVIKKVGYLLKWEEMLMVDLSNLKPAQGS